MEYIGVRLPYDFFKKDKCPISPRRHQPEWKNRNEGIDFFYRQVEIRAVQFCGCFDCFEPLVERHVALIIEVELR